MTCEKFRDALFETLRGRPAGDGFEAHRASCAPCARVQADIAANERVLRGATAPKAPPEVWASIARAVESGRSIPFRRTRFAAWAAVAAGLLIALSMGVPRAPKPTLDVVFMEVRPETRQVFQSFLPRYEGSGGLLANAGGLDRLDR